MLFRIDATLREKAAAALAGLQRNASAMAMLRSRIESRLASLTSAAGEGPELARVLELVRTGELALGELAGKVELARYLEEFVGIMRSAHSSVGDIKVDMEQMVPAAEVALQEMQDTISTVSGGLYSGPAHAEAQKGIIDEAAAVVPASAPVQAPAKATPSVAEELEAELA